MMWAPIPGVRVVGITGRARHGKDELAKAIIRTHRGAERFAFSDALAAHCRAVGLMDARNAGTMQAIGTHLRSLEPGIWLRCVYRAIEDKAPALAVVTGIRYQDEAEMIRQMGGTLVAIIRPNAPPLTDRDPSHESEAHVDALIGQASEVWRADEMPDKAERKAWFDLEVAGTFAEHDDDIDAVPV